MADFQQDPTVQLRKNVVAAEKARDAARARESAQGKAAQSAPTEAARAEHRRAEEELQVAAAALVEAQDELANFLDNQREANEDDPLPQTDYRLSEIVERLGRYQQRATYAAVGDFLNAKPWMVRGWFKGSEAVDNSFIVSAETGAPTNYPSSKIHPSLTVRPAILSTSDELLRWMQSHASR